MNKQSQKAKFKLKHKIGDVIKGKIIEYKNTNTALIALEEFCFLAKTMPNYPQGTLLKFKIIDLEPQIVLQPIDPHRIEIIV